MRTRFDSVTAHESPTTSPQPDRPSIRSTVTRRSYSRISVIGRRLLWSCVRTVFTEGSDFEATAGYSRAVRIGPHVAVSATAARAGGDAHAQATEALQRALAAALELGARP